MNIDIRDGADYKDGDAIVYTIVEKDLEYEYILKLIEINGSPWF